MNKDKLIKLLDEQKIVLQEMIQILKQKQIAIVKNDSVALEEANHLEEIILNKLSRKEVERVNLIRNLSEDLGLNLSEINSNTIKEFYKHLKTKLNNEEYESLSNTRNENKKLVEQASMINKQNKLLVEQANSFIKQVINVLFKSQNKPLLDRKA